MSVYPEEKEGTERCCPRCGHSDVSSMKELHERVSGPSNDFSADLADWLSPPKRPVRPVSRRHRTGVRNSIAFGIVWVLIFSAAYFALSGALPELITLGGVVCFGALLGLWNWRTESTLADREDRLLRGAHLERQRAFLQRKRVWTRLFYCSRCGLVVDPITHQTASLYDVHELANSKVWSLTYKGVERRTAPRKKPLRKGSLTKKTHGV
jgi:hypothetical protein